jgi:hypothetical protein
MALDYFKFLLARHGGSGRFAPHYKITASIIPDVSLSGPRQFILNAWV